MRRHKTNVRYPAAAAVVVVLLAVGTTRVAAQEADSTGTTQAVTPALDVESTLAAAAAAYDAGQYAECTAMYEQVAAAAGTSSALYYNLGNSYYKQGQWARAILNYERCLLVDPSNADARANLELAQSYTVDKIESIQPLIFVQWSRALRDTMSGDAWSRVSVVVFLVFLVAVALYFFGRRTALRKAGFYTAVVAVVLTLVAMYYAAEQRDVLVGRDSAIVVAPTVTVRSSPAESGTQLFNLHEGAKVRVRSAIGEWSEVVLSDGNVGWLLTSAVEVI